MRHLDIPVKATGPIKQYDIKTFLASQGEDSDGEDHDLFDDSPTLYQAPQKQHTKLIIKESNSSKLMKQKIQMDQANEQKINQYNTSVNVGVKRTKLEESRRFQDPMLSMPNDPSLGPAGDFIGNGGASKLQRITLNSSKQTKGSKKGSNSNSKSKKYIK